MAAGPVRGRRGALGPGAAGEPECKRACRLLGTAPGEAGAQLVGCAMDQDSRQKLLPASAPWAAKTKQNSVILENHGSKGISQPCPRCVAGESSQNEERCKEMLDLHSKISDLWN
ncbi:uncharacterized protein C10orf143 homolog isoform X3 [Onychostruthus taczanowskii]|uniref:uncharacterized protein C10orf143 homolog isoform X3 n=1 Tax=Onychostruthus taczanowskii TaxID=356909 RepID=UPI001B802467|nr:uncharacterized protein C10orf143 homolog isoform X3 [Onychostruthus taczanowskii]